MADECEDINIAQDFAKIGGLSIVTTYLFHDEPEFQWRAAAIIISLSQNFPAGQQLALENDVMLRLVNLLETSHDKVLHCLNLHD